MTTSIATNQTILVVGGGIGGMTAALEAAECGKQVILVERNATLGAHRAVVTLLSQDVPSHQRGIRTVRQPPRSEPEKSQKQIRDIVESAYDHGAEMIVTPCQLCQANVEVYQSEINKQKGTKLAMPVVYYSQLMTVAYGGSLKEAGLDGHVIQPERLWQITERKK